MKKEIRLTSYNGYDLQNKPIDFVISQLVKYKKEFSMYYEKIFLAFGYGEVYDVPYLDVEIIGLREEEKDEKEAREKYDERERKQIEDREKKQLERLKDKYENNS